MELILICGVLLQIWFWKNERDFSFCLYLGAGAEAIQKHPC